MSKKSITSLLFVLGANIGEFQTEMRKATREMEKWGKDVQKIGRNFSMYLTAPIVAFGTGSVMAFRSLNEAMKQVDAGILSTGGAAGYTSGELRKMATELGHMSNTLNADILKSVTAQMLTFTNITGQGFKDAQVAALNLSARLDQDLKSSAIMLGKALNDPIQGLTALRRVGIQFNDQQKEMIKTMMDAGDVVGAQNVILKELEVQFGGSAAAAGDAFTRMKNSATMMGQQFGEIIFKTIEPFVNKITALIKGFDNLSESQKKTIVIIAGVAAAIGPVLLSIGFMAKTLIPMMISGFVALQSVMIKTFALMAANPITALITLLTAAAAALLLFRKRTDHSTEAQWKLGDAVRDTNEAIGEQIYLNLVDMYEHMTDGTLKAVGSIEKLTDSLSSLTKGELESLRMYLERAIPEATREMANATNDLIKMKIQEDLEKYRKALVMVEGELKKFKVTTEAVVTATKEELGIIETLNEELKHWKDMELKAQSVEMIAQSIARQEQVQREINQIQMLVALQRAMARPMKTAEGKDPTPVDFSGAIAGMDVMIERGKMVKRELSDAAKAIVEDWNTMNLSMQASYQILEEIGWSVGPMLNEIGAAISGMGTNFKSVVSSMLGGFKQIINGALAMAIGKMIAGEATKGLPGLITGAIGVGLLKALWDSKVPKLAFGGVVPPGYPNDTYPALLSSGEQITPPQKLNYGASTTGHSSGVTRARLVGAGADMLFFLDEANRRYR